MQPPDYWQQILAPGGCEAGVGNVGYVAKALSRRLRLGSRKA
jgi:hypothetical protein